MIKLTSFKIVCIFLVGCMALMGTIAFSDDFLPMAPKRYDGRDELPTAPFVSLTGVDPLPPGERPNPTSVASKPTRSAKKENLRSPASLKKTITKKKKISKSTKTLRVSKKSRLKNTLKKRRPSALPSKLPNKKARPSTR